MQLRGNTSLYNRNYELKWIMQYKSCMRVEGMRTKLDDG